MKARKILFATVCSALFFSSCGNEDEPVGGFSNKQFTVKLKTDFDLIATRATSPSEGNENVISNTKILLYNGAGNLIGSKDVTTSLASGDITVSLEGEATPGDVSSVYVLGNLTGAGTDVFQTDAADFDAKTSVDNSHITVSVNGMKNESAFLPFAGASSSITDGAATVNLKRKAARLLIKNETGEEISYEITNVSTSFGGFMDETKVTDDTPAALANITSTNIAADKRTQKLYLLPNTSTANQPVLKVVVGGVEKTLNLRLEANKAYTYTVTKVTSSDVTISVTVEDIWSDVQEGELNFGGNTPHVAVEIPARAYASTVALPAEITSTTGLTASATNFSVTFAQGTGADAGKVMATVTPVRPYVTADISEKIPVSQGGATVAYLDGSQKAWQFEEVTFGNRTFMDRDLGAEGAGEVGELFGVGSLIPVDQSSAPANYVPNKAKFTGNGRISISTYASLPLANASGAWFAGNNGVKNPSSDPCPTGWHVAKLSDLQLIFTSGDNTNAGVGNTDGNNAISGALNSTLVYNASARTVNVSVGAASTVFSANTKLINTTAWGSGSDIKAWPVGWWTSTKTSDNNKFYNLAFNFTNTTAQPLRAQLRPNYNLNGRYGMLIRCVKD